MRPVQAITTCFRKSFQFSGRASRAEYWWFVLFILLGSIALIILNSAIFGPELLTQQVNVLQADGTTKPVQHMMLRYTSGWFGNIFFLICLFPMLSVGWRRLHDTNVAGWWFLAPVAVTILLIITTILLTIGPSAALSAISDGQMIKVQLTGTVGLIAAIVILVPPILLLLRLIRRSDPGTNTYGPNPTEAST